MSNSTVEPYLDLYRNEVLPHQYCATIGLSLALSDICHTLPREIRFFWQGRYSVPRVMYFIIRYAPLFFTGISAVAAFEASPSRTFCTAFPYLQFTIGTVHVWAVQVVLLLRIHAIYANARLFRLLVAFFLVTIAVQAGLGFSAEASTRWERVGIFGCLPFDLDKLRNFLWLSWLPTLAFDIVVFALAMLTFRQYKNIAKMSVTRRTLLSTLLRDSFQYFTVIVLILIVYMYVARSHIEYVEDLSDIVICIISACGVRLLYNLKSHIETEDGHVESVEYEYTGEGTPMTSLAFREEPQRQSQRGMSSWTLE